MPDRPRLLILAFSPIHRDARVLRQVRLLAGRYEVTTCGYGPKPDGADHHVQIPDELIYWHKSRSLLIQRRYAAVYRSNAVVRHLRDALPREHFDVVLADDIDTVPLALSLHPRGGVHADMHEYAPRENEHLWRWRWFVAPYVRWQCRTFLTRVDSVSTVGEGLATEYDREFGIHASVVVNAAPLAPLAPARVADPIRLVHSGNAQRNRALGLMVDAVEAASRPVTLDLYLVPNDAAYLEELRARVAGNPAITIHDPVPPADLPRTLAAHDVGVFVLPPVTFNYLWTLPNKFFDYVQARLGLIVGPSPEMAGLVRRHGLGAVTDGFTAADLTRAIDELDPANVARWKHASHAVAEEYSAERQVQGWADAVDALAARAR
ncbi:glycosyltransferase family protein [Georgenia ruanii]|uniref:glycosyltransferase family 1 protein n=1 Tax=Georgenia ruanii TaxID=348442 RepID=UPI0012649A02|nr:glycosyltransferase family 1 protein [Georgenia ruanii]